MFRIPLVISLVLMQLVAASGGSVYLCVANDGSLCCLDFGPQFCRCCPHGHDKVSSESAPSDQCHSGCCHQEASHEASDQPDEDQSIANSPCHCQHLAVATGTALLKSRATVGNPLIASTQLWTAITVRSFLTDPLACRQSERIQAPSPAPDSALALLSTVIIRC